MNRLIQFVVFLGIFYRPNQMAAQEGEGEKPADNGGSKKTISAPMPMLHDVAKMSPEELMSYVRNELQILGSRLKGFDQLYNKEGLGSQEVEAASSFSKGKEDFHDREYRSTIRNLNGFLNRSQTVDIKKYLEAQYMLGKSYRSLSELGKSQRAYARYLATLATNPEHFSQRAVDVIADLFEIIEQDPTQPRKKLDQIMAALTSLEVAKPQRAWIYFYAGKAARIAGNNKVSLHWLERTIKIGRNSRLRARARYNRSLIYVSQKKYKEAILDLEFALSEGKDHSLDYREWAKLTLARVYVHLRKPKTSLEYYE